MAQVLGALQLKGSIDGLTFYERYGKKLARKHTSLCKKKMYANPHYERTLENCMEFGGCSKVATSVRNSLYEAFGRNIFDFKHTPQLLISVLRKISLVSKGGRGKRNIEIARNKEILNNIQLAGYYPGKKMSKNNFTAPYSIEIDSQQGKAKLYIPSFVPKHFISKPKGSSHFSITLGVFGISDYFYNQDKGTYSAKNSSSDLWKVIKSEKFSVDQSRIPEQTLCVEIDISGKNIDNIKFFAAVGITFWQKSGDQLYTIPDSGSLILKTVSTELLKDENTKTSTSSNKRNSIEYFRWVDLNDLIREIYRNPEQPHHHTEYVLME